MTRDIPGEISNLYRKDERAAFRLLFDTYYASLVLFANRIVGNETAAEDIVQDSLVSLWQSKSFRNVREGMDRYLYQTVRNKSIDYLKAENRNVSLPESVRERLTHMPVLHEEDIEEYGQLYRAIEMLPADRKKIFKLVYFEGYKYQEAAAKLGISINTVQTQLRRSLQFLREKLNAAPAAGDTASVRKLNDITFNFLMGISL